TVADSCRQDHTLQGDPQSAGNGQEQWHGACPVRHQRSAEIRMRRSPANGIDQQRDGVNVTFDRARHRGCRHVSVPCDKVPVPRDGGPEVTSMSYSNSGGSGSSGGPMVEINVTPLVDVMLVLVIFFIITAPMLTHK